MTILFFSRLQENLSAWLPHFPWFFVDYSSSSAGALLDFGTRNLLLLVDLLGKFGRRKQKLDIRVSNCEF